MKVGSNPLPNDVQVELADFVDRLGDIYEFKNGQTALYWNLVYVLAQHIGEGKE